MRHHALHPNSTLLLNQLKHNRHALSIKNPANHALIADIIPCFYTKNHQDYANPHQEFWYLIGTDGCHLCDTAEQIIKQAFAITPTPPSLQTLDLIDSHDDGLLEIFGHLIPIVLAKDRIICYPFSVLDIVDLLNS